jgi:hypothetical protein
MIFGRSFKAALLQINTVQHSIVHRPFGIFVAGTKRSSKLYGDGGKWNRDYLFAIQKVTQTPKGKICLGRRFSEFHAALA